MAYIREKAIKLKVNYSNKNPHAHYLNFLTIVVVIKEILISDLYAYFYGQFVRLL